LPFPINVENDNKVTLHGRVLDTREEILNEVSPKPINRKGRRSIDYPFHGECLMHSPRHNWKAWTCEKWSNLGLDSVYQKPKSIAPYYGLLSEIYPGFRRKYDPVI
jgi:hypothetical protein